MEDCFWSLYYTTDQIRIDGLRTIQMQGLLSCLNKNGLDEYMIWQEGTDDWVSASSLYEQILEASKLYLMPPMPPEFAADESASLSQAPIDHDRQILHKTGEAARIDAEEVANLAGVQQRQPIESAPVEDPAQPSTEGAPAQETPTNINPRTDIRMSPRFMISFKVFITYNGRVMKNETVNVSVGGMKLKTPLDIDAKGSVEVMLMHDGKELNMRCKILKDEGAASGASRLFIEKCNRMDILRTWILSGNHKPIG